MSISNGVYILKTGREYRVKHIHPLDFLYEGNTLGVHVNDLNPVRVLLEFGDCKQTSNAELAIKIAFKKMKEIGLCDSSIKIIDAECFWKDIVKISVKVASEEIKLYPDTYDSKDRRMHEKKWLEEVIHKYSKDLTTLYSA